uniref:protein broad-minded n=1 Tax=Doryrhamphus excisus TaxID=161450 RepID=UPI0025AE37CE|nr:protein broad-minded [Doryrhamphus excisus]XP_057920246.1 protein broad-minded [Doryrhamphus excisus]XP_057920253.1 protein broad-minded [Doryrhamphus excisus]XP_057920261.1 protein broad-minded [Doryrhamphus excisus]
MSSEDEEHFQALLKQLLKTINDRLSGAPSPQSAEEILLQLEETDRNFHNYELVKYLRHYVETSLGSVVDEEIRKLSGKDGQHIGSGHDTLIHSVTNGSRASAQYLQMTQTLKATMTAAVESLVSRFEEDQLRKGEMRQREGQHNHYADDCSDSDSSFNQSYAFIRQEQLQALAEKLDASQPKEVRREALQVLCCAPPSDVLSCESWAHLRQNLCAALIEPDSALRDLILRFFAKSFSSSPLNVTREIYTSLAKSVETIFLSLKLSLPSVPAGLDINRPEISSLLKQMRLMNDFQKEVTAFWIRHPEKYMEEIIESTFSLLCLHCEPASQAEEKALEPIHLLAVLDVEAAWFKKWMHGSYSRTVVLRLLQGKYKSLMEASVQQCVLYLESGQTSTHLQCEEEQHSPGLDQRSVYTAKELQYAVVVHSLCVLGKVLLYSNGRKLFPVTVRSRKEPVSLTDLLVILINIIYQHPEPLCADTLHTDSLSPSSLVMSTLWMICERAECADECLHKPAVIETLLAPVIALLGGHQARIKSPESILPLIADILARMVNTDRGLALFLYERNLLVGHGERVSAAYVVVQFTLRLLDEELSSTGKADVPRALCGAFIFVCRQLYNTCEGLQVLRPYGLHKAAAAAWRKTSSLSERILSPVPGNNPETSTQERLHMLVWEETLLDSLLNFAATPKGLLLLQQTGAMQGCISYMFSRFNKKLQVSRCEKFGYGVMVTQVAATAAGAAALHRSGFVQALVLDLWSALECSSEDARVVHPKPTPMDPIDRTCLKSFLSLVNVLSASQSLWQLLAGQPLANKIEYTLREVPSSVADVIDRLIAVNSAAKIHALFHYEQSHAFGLRLLSVLCSSLDSFLLLESQYGICSMLLQSQRENVADRDASSRSCIIDSLSVERNHVLVRVALVGGPSERRLPPRALQQGDDPYPWPMFSSFPPPSCYTLDPPNPQHNPLEPEMSAFLTTKMEENWMESCRQIYCKVLTSGQNSLSGAVLADLLEKAVVHLSKSSAEHVFSPPQHKEEEEEEDVDAVVLSPVEILGMDVCLRYGASLKLLQEDARRGLTLLTKHVKIFLSRQRVQTSPELLVQHEDYPGHDWLASTVFLMMAGDWRRCWTVLVKLSSLLTSALIWPARIHASVDVAVQVAESGILPVYWSTAHYVEMLLKAELPLVHSAFRMSGFTPSQICLHWLTQCFWNFLDWPEIRHYVCTCVLLGPDYQVYTCMALFRHLQPDLLRRTQARQLQVFLKEEPIKGFKFCNYLDFMEVLERRYRSIVLTDMKTIGKPAD